MQTLSHAAAERAAAENQSKTQSTSNQAKTESVAQVLSPAEWARQVLGITTPFGHDRLPTVWG